MKEIDAITSRCLVFSKESRDKSQIDNLSKKGERNMVISGDRSMSRVTISQVSEKKEKRKKEKQTNEKNTLRRRLSMIPRISSDLIFSGK